MRFRLIPGLLAGLFAALLLTGLKPADGEEPAAPAADVQARGPVHEAYAEPTGSVGAPGVIVPKEPPQPIEEIPPDQKPEGDHVIWIPGYWSWDDDTKDFLWISGFWRAVPPDRAWTPGNWQQVDDGWQWVAGFWSDPTATETEYLPTPPASIDNGPSTPAPDDTSTYVPGCWLYQSNRYLWRTGYWLPYRPGWVWTPACNRWTPAGYVYNAGYWDMPLLERGLLFAPVRFQAAEYERPGFSYQPSYAIQPDFLLSALFVRAGQPAYYFGDYFEPRYRKNFVSWVNYRVHRTVFDPNFSYYRTSYRESPTWERNLQTLYQGRYEGTVPRPPVTLVQQTKVINSITTNRTTNTVVTKNVNITNLQNVSVLAPIKQAGSIHVTALASLAGPRAGAGKSPAVSHEMRLQPVSKERKVEEQRSAARLRAISKDRSAAQTKVARPPAAGAAPVKVQHTLPKETPAARTINHPVKAPPPPPHEKTPPRKAAAPPVSREKPRAPSPPAAREPERPKTPPAPKEKPRTPTPPPHEPEKPRTPPASAPRPTTPPPHPPAAAPKPPAPAPHPPAPAPKPPAAAPHPPVPPPHPPAPAPKPPAPAPKPPAAAPHPPAPPPHPPAPKTPPPAPPKEKEKPK